MAGRRYSGSEQSQPACFAIWGLGFSVKSSRFFWAFGRDYSEIPLADL